jgi:hypothetical protein
MTRRRFFKLCAKHDLEKCFCGKARWWHLQNAKERGDDNHLFRRKK